MTRVSLFLTTLLLWSACSGKRQALTVQFIPSPAGEKAGEPYLFTDSKGKIYLSWIERQDTISTLKFSQWQSERWSEAVTIASGDDWFVNWADYPLIVSDGKGNFMAHFLGKSGPKTFDYDVKITTSSDGTTWTEPFVIHDDGTRSEHGFVSLVPYGEHVLVSWLDGRNTVGDNPEGHHDHGHHGEMTIRAAVVTYDEKKLEEWELDNRVCDCCQTAAAITARGPVVIYRDRSDDEIRDVSIVRWVNGEWTLPKSVYPDNWKINGCPVNGPRCEAIGNTLAVAWFTMADDTPLVKVAFSTDSGETFSKPITMNEQESMGRVDLVLLDEDTALVSWMEGTEIKAAKVYRNGRKTPSVTVAESSSARSSGFPQITRMENGVMVAWTDDEVQIIRVARLSF